MTAITLSGATAVINAAVVKSTEIGVDMNIAVVDAAGHLVHFARMNSAWLGSIDISIKKAKTSVLFRMPSAAIGELSQPGGSLYNIEISNGGLISFGGGVPLLDEEGHTIGGVGVSGGSVEQDVIVAEAAAKAI
ncbi:GlcG/HbpS family heme-binding protein [Nocardia pseudovaccinii]|uniref:GlcG/HbpS family heme-binding protein n=1 Tax=Nocardia pseudovaccinii TaxID=189540 RepID=UPI0007A4E2E1|nr:heme-binding protein [Nocardia pseudovaccinii]